MKASYLVKLIEDFCNENKLNISDIYKQIAEIYQAEYGINIDYKMREDGYYDMPLYLEQLGIIERYIMILNGLKTCINKDWKL